MYDPEGLSLCSNPLMAQRRECLGVTIDTSASGHGIISSVLLGYVVVVGRYTSLWILCGNTLK